MRFSDLLTEYLDLREAGEPRGEWQSIDDIAQKSHVRTQRMQEILDTLDEMTGTVPPPQDVAPRKAQRPG